MEYFFDHIGVIVVAAIAIAVIAFVMVIVAEKNEKERDINEERCNLNCSGCANASICTKEEKKDVL